MDFLHSFYMLDFDERVQSSSEILAAFEIFLSKIRNSNIYIHGWCSDYIFYVSYTDPDNWGS